MRIMILACYANRFSIVSNNSTESASDRDLLTMGITTVVTFATPPIQRTTANTCITLANANSFITYLTEIEEQG